MDSVSWRWPENALSWRSWGDDIVVYNDLSGHTHRLTRQQFQLLRAFETGPRTLHEVLAGFADAGAMKPADRPEQLVAELEGLGLLQQQRP